MTQALYAHMNNKIKKKKNWTGGHSHYTVPKNLVPVDFVGG
jgi:hypothetical protein